MTVIDRLSAFRTQAGVLIFAMLVGAITMGAFSRYWQFFLAQYAVAALAALGVNITVGMAGVLSLASPVFMAVGAYGTVLLMTVLDVPFIVAAPVSVMASSLLGWLIGLISARIKGLQFAIITLGFLLVSQSVLVSGGDLTGGTYGLVTPPTTLPFVGEMTDRMIGFIAVATLVLVAVGCHFFANSRTGRAMVGMKSQETATELTGVYVARLKALAMAACGGVTAIAGVLYALVLGTTQPDSYGIGLALFHLTIVVVAGMSANVTSVLVSSAILYIVPEFFLWLGPYRELFYASLMLAVLIMAPRGLLEFDAHLRGLLLRNPKIGDR